MMVNSKKKDILERYRTLLESNLVLTDDLLFWLRDKKAFPEFVVNDIKVCCFRFKLFYCL